MKKPSTPVLAAVALLVGLVAAPAAQAQPNWRATPMFGTVNLRAGFTPDPHVVQVRAGGADRNSISGSGCAGYINNAQPDVDLNYRAGRSRLYIYVRSDIDTTLLVNLPNGNWVCSDDYNGNNPAIVLNSPLSGNYNIWVGTYSSSNTGATANVYISELTPRW
ncbi:MAG TPA: hypothetical protein VD962_01270 [Rubricoccaceae bacterium]|nr:hypothetical protein [Rubricoccaceae bacterium]